MSIVELYNEKVFDVLAAGPPTAKANRTSAKLLAGDGLRVREHPTSGPYVEKLTKMQVTSFGQVQEVVARLQASDAGRASHTLFFLTLTQWFPAGNDTPSLPAIHAAPKPPAPPPHGEAAPQHPPRRPDAPLNLPLVPATSAPASPAPMLPRPQSRARSEASPPPSAKSSSLPSSPTKLPLLAPLDGASRAPGRAPSQGKEARHGGAAASSPPPRARATPAGGSPRYTARASTITLCDLAGPDKGFQAAGAAAADKSVSSSLYKSLANLSHVIQQLGGAREGPGAAFIPWRVSALTWLLKENLSGANNRTVMLATVAPAGPAHDATMGTLMFADRVKQVMCRQARAPAGGGAGVALLRDLIDTLAALQRSQKCILRLVAHQKRARAPPAPRPASPSPGPSRKQQRRQGPGAAAAVKTPTKGPRFGKAKQHWASAAAPDPTPPAAGDDAAEEDLETLWPLASEQQQRLLTELRRDITCAKEDIVRVLQPRARSPGPDPDAPGTDRWGRATASEPHAPPKGGASREAVGGGGAPPNAPSPAQIPPIRPGSALGPASTASRRQRPAADPAEPPHSPAPAAARSPRPLGADELVTLGAHRLRYLQRCGLAVPRVWDAAPPPPPGPAAVLEFEDKPPPPTTAALRYVSPAFSRADLQTAGGAEGADGAARVCTRHLTIADALAAAAAGDEVVVHEGVYEGPIVVERDVLLRGLPGAEHARPKLKGLGPPVLTVQDTAAAVIEGFVIEQQGGGEAAVILRRSTCTLQDCEVFGRGVRACVHVKGPCLGLIQRNVIRDGLNNAAGVLVTAGACPEVRDNTIEGHGDAAVVVEDEDDDADLRAEGARAPVTAPYVHRNRLVRGRGAGVAVVGRGSVPTIEDNAVLDCEDAGVVVEDGADPLLTGNVIAGCGGGGVIVRGAHTRGRIVNCHIHSNRERDVFVTAGARPAVEQNTIHGGSGYGIVVAQGAAGHFTGNSVHGYADHCVLVRERATPSFVANHIGYGQHRGVLVYDGGLGTFEQNTFEGAVESRSCSVRTHGRLVLRDNRFQADMPPGEEG